MNRTTLFPVLLLLLLTACANENISRSEAISLSIIALEKTAVEDQISPESLQLVNATWSAKLSVWEVYYANKDKSYQLNILVKNSEMIEVHRFDTSRILH